MKACEYCEFCKFPRSSDDNGGSCKCKLLKYKTINVSVCGGETPQWCPLQRSATTERKENER